MRQSDLAKERAGTDLPTKGIDYEEVTAEDYRCERLHVTNGDGARAIGRPMGHYNTVCTRPFHALSAGERQSAISAVTTELFRLCKPYLKEESAVLVVGLGNREIVADSIGVRAVSRVRQTASVKREARGIFDRLGCAEIRTLCPGVEGQTGIAAATLVRAILKESKTSLVIAIDALATRSTERLCSTLQLSDTGIFPASGLGLRKEGLNEQSLGVPVVAVGVPTVQSSHAFFLEEAQRQGLTEAAVPKGAPVFFCPNTLEQDVSSAAELLGEAINRAFGIESPEK